MCSASHARSSFYPMRPLEGITVVTLEHAIAAPFCTRQLADLGARVIKIERPGVGDFARSYDERVYGLASHFVWTNRSKESLTLDVKHPDAQAILKRLILERADVVVQNLAPGAAARLGVSHEALSREKPALILCDISGYGSDGPYRDKKAYDLLIGMNDMHDVWAHEQLEARGRWTRMPTPAGNVPALVPPGQPSVYPPRMEPIPALGEHTDAILRQLWLHDLPIARLRAEGAV